MKGVPLGWSPWVFLVLLLLGTGIWFGLRWLQESGIEELSRKRNFGPVTIYPEGFKSDGWLRYTWTKFRADFPGGSVTLVKPEVVLRLATTRPYYEHVRIKMNSCILTLDSSSQRKEKNKDTTDFSFPDFNLPLKFAIQTARLQVIIPGTGSWYSDSTIIRNSDKNTVLAEIKDIRGKFLPLPVSTNLAFNWSHQFLESEISLTTETDSLHLFVETPKERITGISIDLIAFTQNPREWIPRQLPTDIPEFNNLRINAKSQLDFDPFNLEWSASASLQLGPLPKLPRGIIQVNGKGNHKGSLDGTFDWKGEGGENIQGSILVSEQRKIELQARIQNTYIDIGSHRLNADGQIRNAILFNDTLKASILTQSGSLIDAQLNNLSDPQISFQANISPTEPWAISWCNGNLQIAPPAKIEGEFLHGILTANVKASVPFAYKATAETFETDLTLSSNGVHFDNGEFTTRGVSHYFTGEVIWDSASGQHFQFELAQDSGGVARVFGDFDGHISLNVSSLPTWKLPLADTSILKGIRATLTGNWEHRFESKFGILRMLVETNYQNIPIEFQIQARQNLDSIILEDLEAKASGNILHASALALIDTTLENPIIPEHVSLQTQGFSVPAILHGFGDTTIENATLQGQFTWDRRSGFDGKFSIPDIQLSTVSADYFRIQRFQLLGTGDQLQASARVHLGPDGVWDSETEINLRGVLSENKGLAAAIVADNGGVLWLEGVLDSSYKWQGEAHLEGLWYLPGGAGQIENSKFSSKLKIDPAAGLKGIQASLNLDTAVFVSGGFKAPLRVIGNLDSGMLSLTQISIYGQDSSRIQGKFGLDLIQGQIRELEFQSKLYQLDFANTHHLTLYDFSGSATKTPQEMQISVLLPKAEYHMKDSSLGKAYGRIDANLLYHIPTNTDSNMVRKNSRIEGRAHIQRFMYEKMIEIEPSQIPKLLQKASGSLKSISQKKVSDSRKKESIKKSKPTELDIRILDAGLDSLFVNTSVTRFPFTLDVQVQGTTENPLLNGDINAIGKGYLGFETLADFQLQSLRVSWQDQAPKKGQLDVLATTEIPYCEENEEGRIEKCPVTLNVNGPLTEPNPVPFANCTVESSPAQIYYAVLILGCFPSESSSTFDVNGAGGKIVGMIASKQTNAWLGGDYVGNIGLKWRFTDPNTMEQRDSNYIRVPVKLDRWVKNLSFVVGYSQDLSQNPRYDQSYEAGLKYSMPVLDSGEQIPNHVDPTLDFSGSLIQRKYQASLSGNDRESKLERNIGVAYSWKFWDYCVFGFGNCNLIQQEKKP